ncbi:hypothetical protein [uncultured Proteiniphilum sp.]|uniref:hypothetical protein n=1 Tax=uncultured Proteiniphilum sp. TaxID=497637 RepID=UPI002630462F|nr:hypothetical protein [uncultured Proteiniphilum sp.]
MKKKLFFSTVSVFFLLFLGYGCSGDDYLSDREIQQMIDNSLNGQWRIIPFEVKKTDWEWIPDAGYYQAIYELPELTQDIYEEGAVLGYIFIGQQGEDEVQKSLPYPHTYYETDINGNVTNKYTETISYDVQYKTNGESSVAFYIQNSDLLRRDEYVYNYNFRIVLIW